MTMKPTGLLIIEREAWVAAQRAVREGTPPTEAMVKFYREHLASETTLDRDQIGYLLEVFSKDYIISL